jgi:hypothetical protein
VREVLRRRHRRRHRHPLRRRPPHPSRWLVRYANEGLAAVADKSSKPDFCPRQMAPEIEARIVELRRGHPGWGPRTILNKLRRELGEGSGGQRTSFGPSTKNPGQSGEVMDRLCTAFIVVDAPRLMRSAERVCSLAWSCSVRQTHPRVPAKNPLGMCAFMVD